MVLIGYLLLRLKDDKRRQWLFVFVSCIIGTALAILPNALLPNHHYSGYSFNGAYLFYLPIFFLCFLYTEKRIPITIAIIAVVVCIISPFLNTNKYKENDWVILQEKTQRNLLNALGPLFKDMSPTDSTQKVLVEGLTFPFYPFHHPYSLRAFPNSQYAVFDVVDYHADFQKTNQRTNFVLYISPADTAISYYDRKWVFDGEGRLIKSIKFSKDGKSL